MEIYRNRDGKQLRLGYTTGTCAAAAAKAAAWMLLTGNRKEQISIHTPKGIDLNLEILDISMRPGCVRCAVRKDSGDDPDITGGTLIYAEVSTVEDAQISASDRKYGDSISEEISKEREDRTGRNDVMEAPKGNGTGRSMENRILIDGGEGIGRVTKRGLDQPPGAAAINSVPRQMIRENVEEICRLTDYQGALSVIISAPEGEELAKKTFNPRLGITGGISILGTTGIVEPMSEQALVDTIRVELRQRRAEGTDYVLLTPGNYGAEFIQNGIGMDSTKAVMVSNFIGDSLDICREMGFAGALLVGHIGKLVKIAGGMLNTHSRYGDCRMEILAAHAGAKGLDASKIKELLECATCDDALRILKETSEKLCGDVLAGLVRKIAFIMDHRVGGEMETGAILFSREYGFLCETKNARALLRRC